MPLAKHQQACVTHSHAAGEARGGRQANVSAGTGEIDSNLVRFPHQVPQLIGVAAADGPREVAAVGQVERRNQRCLGITAESGAQGVEHLMMFFVRL